MNRAWAASLSEFWHSASFPLWLTIIAAALFAVILVITLLRAEKSAANGALIVITLLAVGIAAVAMMRSSSVSNAAKDASRQSLQVVAGLPALSCLDGLAGEDVETACEKAVFASADSTAAAVSYVAAQISRLASYGNVAAADKVMTPELQALRRAVERDRYGIVAHVLTVRDGCNLSACAFFQSLTNTAQISINMSEKAYEGFVGQYMPSWNAPASAPVATSALPPSVPSGKTLTGEFPASSASIPPVNIMTPEPAAAPPAPKTAEEGSPRTSGASAAKKPSAQKPRAQAPASLAPPAATDDN
ncbi:MAG: hypothetical protein EKK40_12990 [Bradyrhizobiaceae bacterium]|nr:MAG: hypothetical protein EKK40_12990 [Bradyrhizobiaceae bacterium]